MENIENKVLDKVEGVSNLEINKKAVGKTEKRVLVAIPIVGLFMFVALAIGLKDANIARNDFDLNSYKDKNRIEYTANDFIADYEQEYNLTLSPNDIEVLKLVRDWSASYDTGELGPGIENNSDIPYVYGHNKAYHDDLINLVDVAKKIVVEDAMNSKNFPDTVGSFVSDHCKVVSAYTESGIKYYVQLETYNSFQETYSNYYSEVTDKYAIEMLDYCTALEQSGILSDSYLIPPSYKTDISEYHKQNMELASNGDPLATYAANAIHNHFQFKNWQKGEVPLTNYMTSEVETESVKTM